MANGKSYTLKGEEGKLFVPGDCDDAVQAIVEAISEEWVETLLRTESSGRAELESIVYDRR